MNEYNEKKVNIFKSSSLGNAVIIDDILFDCKLTKKEFEFLKEQHDFKYIFVTHGHGDHIPTPNVIKKFLLENEDVTLYALDNVALGKLKMKLTDKQLVLIKPNKSYFVGDTVVHVHPGKHDTDDTYIEVVGFTFYKYGNRMVYATDNKEVPSIFETTIKTTPSLIPGLEKSFVRYDGNKFSTMFIEGNHSKAILEQLCPSELRGRFSNSHTHNSQENVRDYIFENALPNSSVFVLHRSSGTAQVGESFLTGGIDKPLQMIDASYSPVYNNYFDYGDVNNIDYSFKKVYNLKDFVHEDINYYDLNYDEGYITLDERRFLLEKDFLEKKIIRDNKLIPFSNETIEKHFKTIPKTDGFSGYDKDGNKISVDNELKEERINEIVKKVESHSKPEDIIENLKIKMQKMREEENGDFQMDFKEIAEKEKPKTIKEEINKQILIAEEENNVSDKNSLDELLKFTDLHFFKSKETNEKYVVVPFVYNYFDIPIQNIDFTSVNFESKYISFHHDLINFSKSLLYFCKKENIKIIYSFEKYRKEIEALSKIKNEIEPELELELESKTEPEKTSSNTNALYNMFKKGGLI